MRPSTLLPLIALIACAPELDGPSSLGDIAGPTKNLTSPGNKSVSFIQWRLPDAQTTDMSFRLMVPDTDAIGAARWIPDVYNYTERPVHMKPAASTIQQAVDLCWVELANGDTISAGAVPDTDGSITFRLAYGKDFTGANVNLRCDISEEAELITIGVGLETITLYGPHVPGEGFEWYGTYIADYPGVKTTITIQ